MSLDSVVQVDITTETTSVSRAAFNIPLLCGYHTNFPERVREYDISGGLTGLTDDGFATTDQIYKMAQALAMQDPSIRKIKVGRRANGQDMTLELTPTARDNTLYHVYINGVDFQIDSGAVATTETIVTALDAVLSQDALAATNGYLLGAYVSNSGSVYRCTTAGTSAGSGGPTGTGSGIVDGTCVWRYEGAVQDITPTDDTTHLTVTAGTTGVMFECELSDDYEGLNLWAREDVTADPGLAADLNAIQLEDNDWYVLHLDSQGAAEIEAGATWIEATRKIFGATSGDSLIPTSSGADIASTLFGLSFARTYLVYDHNPHKRAAEAWTGVMLPFDPGSATWKFKRASGVTALHLTTTQIGHLEAKNVNYCIRLGGVPIFQQGVMAVGEFIDIIQGVDWFRARLQERVYLVLVNLKKLPFTSGGIATIESEVWAQLADGYRVGFLAPDSGTVEVPDVASVSASNKIARHLPDVKFAAQLAGAIHSVQITGTISP
jgi:hypothetical protein